LPHSAPAFVVSAIASGQGKTTATAALARHFMAAGLRVRLFKVGADFLDALILERASRHPVHVLDLWMVGESECRRLLDQASQAADVVLIEGAMGLYDGTPSAADLARRLDLAVLAVIDVRAMAQTVGAVALGLRDFGGVRLAGVIANGIASPGHRAMVRSALREVPLLASLARQESVLAERHLGLRLPAESPDIDARLRELGAAIELDEHVWRAIAASATPACSGTAPLHGAVGNLAPGAPPADRRLQGAAVAIARDAAFAFLYPANIDCLERLGAEIVFFSPLADQPVPAHARAVFLPGGYPELHGEPLSRAANFHRSIRAAHAAGVPILAECGGMMALTESVRDVDGRDWPMAAIIPGGTRMQARLAGLGLQAWRTAHGELRGHTFHYSTLETPLAAAAVTTSYPRLTEGERIYRVGSLTASYFHAYFSSCPQAIASILEGKEP
jgi:cobyrinic acid a,c-diamide synthase